MQEEERKTWVDRLREAYNAQRDFNVAKNEGYGNFYFEPIRLFISSLTPKERIQSRLDEKLGRLASKGLDREIAADIIGCLMCWIVLDNVEKEE